MNKLKIAVDSFFKPAGSRAMTDSQGAWRVAPLLILFGLVLIPYGLYELAPSQIASLERSLPFGTEIFCNTDECIASASKDNGILFLFCGVLSVGIASLLLWKLRSNYTQ